MGKAQIPHRLAVLVEVLEAAAAPSPRDPRGGAVDLLQPGHPLALRSRTAQRYPLGDAAKRARE
jgi:hypothetical protein